MKSPVPDNVEKQEHLRHIWLFFGAFVMIGVSSDF